MNYLKLAVWSLDQFPFTELMFVRWCKPTNSKYTHEKRGSEHFVGDINEHKDAGNEVYFFVFLHFLHDFHGIPLKNYGAPVVFFVGLKNLLTWYNFVVPSWISELKIIQLFDNFENDKR